MPRRARRINSPNTGIPVILEAMSEGVVFTSAEHSMHADYVAVLQAAVDRCATGGGPP